MTRKNAPRRECPSIIAASSTSLGMTLKNPISSQVQKGTVKLGYTRTSAQRRSCSPSEDTNRDSGMKRMVGGTR
jgi:hypothetical protein